MASADTERDTLAGRLGALAGRLERLITQTIPSAAGRLGRGGAESLRHRIMSGHWQDYAFLVVGALVVLALVVFALRGCGPVVRP